MTIRTISMSEAQTHFAELLETATNGQPVLVQRRGKPDAAIIDAELLEDYLLATNPRILKKAQAARKEREATGFDETFAGIV